MKKFLFKSIVFFLIGILIYPFLIGFLGSSWLTQRRLTKNLIFFQGGNSFMWTKLQEADTTKNIDVLILGSSIALRGIDTRVFEKYGLRAFNMGSNYQTPLQSEFLLNKYLDQFSPKYVIWEVTPLTFQNSGLESFIDVFSNTDIGIEAFKQSFRISNILAWNSLIISLTRQNFGDYKKYKERDIKGDSKYVNGGYVETNNPVFNDSSKLNSYKIEFLNYQKSSFENALYFLKKNNVKVVLINSPTTTEDFNNIKNWEDIITYFESFKKDRLVYDYRNYNDLIPEFGENTNFFSDKIHLNKVGANEYTEILLDDLRGTNFYSR